MSIRKSQETVHDTDLQQWQGGALPWAFDGVIEASTESALDLESKEKSTSCTVNLVCKVKPTKPPDEFTDTKHRLSHRRRLAAFYRMLRPTFNPTFLASHARTRCPSLLNRLSIPSSSSKSRMYSGSILDKPETVLMRLNGSGYLPRLVCHSPWLLLWTSGLWGIVE